MKAAKILALLGVVVFFIPFFVPGPYDGQFFPYQTGIGLTLFLFALVLGVTIKIKRQFVRNDAVEQSVEKKRKPTAGMWILVGGIVFGIFCWVTSGSNEGFDGFIVVYSYLAILVGGLMVIFNK